MLYFIFCTWQYISGCRSFTSLTKIVHHVVVTLRFLFHRNKFMFLDQIHVKWKVKLYSLTWMDVLNCWNRRILLSGNNKTKSSNLQIRKQLTDVHQITLKSTNHSQICILHLPTHNEKSVTNQGRQYWRDKLQTGKHSTYQNCRNSITKS